MSSKVKISARTRLIAVLGNPITHSWSPQIHNAAFQAQGLDRIYVACQVFPGQAKSALDGLATLGFDGANVTLPLKQEMMGLMDSVSDRARAVGAVNTLVRKTNPDGSLHWFGDNTDVPGFLAPLKPFASTLADTSCCVFGNGGSARAVCYALMTEVRPSVLHLIVRSPEKARDMIASLLPFTPETETRYATFDEGSDAVKNASLLVNTTPLGMSPGIKTSVWEDPSCFSDGQIAYDLVYNPVKTRWLREVESCGGTIINGIDMLLAQAAESYRQWTDLEMPLDAARREIDKLISGTVR